LLLFYAFQLFIQRYNVIERYNLITICCVPINLLSVPRLRLFSPGENIFQPLAYNLLNQCIQIMNDILVHCIIKKNQLGWNLKFLYF